MNVMLESMVVAAPAGESARAAPPAGRAAFRKSPANPANMSRTAQSKTSGHAPSARMLLRMQEAATDLATLAATTSGWRFASERNGAMLYELPGRSLPPNVSTVRKFGRGAGHASDFYLVRAVTTVHTSVDALLDLLHSSTTDEFRLVARQVFGEHFQDGVTIDKLTCTTPPPFAPAGGDYDDEEAGARRSFSQDDGYSVNWLALKALAKLGGVDNHRDFTLVGYQDAFVRRGDGEMERVGRGAASARAAAAAEGQSAQQDGRLRGRMLGVHVLSSVNFEDVPELPLPECTDRLHLRNSGFVIEETPERNTLRLSLFLSLLPSKETLRYARRYQRWLQELAACVGNLAQAVKPEVAVLHMSRLTWKQSDHCFMCVKMFRTFRRCHHCRFCGEAVCGSCSAMINMVGYDITGGLEASSASNGFSRSQRNSASNSSMDGLGASPNPNATTNRSSRGSFRGPMEMRGCHACIAELQRNLTASAVAGSRVKYSGENLAASQYGSVGLPSDDDDVISYDSVDDVDVTRLGSVADYTPSDRGVGALHNALYTPEKPQEPTDEAAMKTEELQDTFPGVEAPPPPRFRNVSDPDQLRRMRNVSDPERLSRLKDKQSTVSMSTASSSFSRTSHEHYLSDNASQYSRGTNFSVMSDASSAGDLSRDPDILALAGLSLKPSIASTASAPTGEQEGLATCGSSERLAGFVLEEPEKEAEAEAEAQAEAEQQQLSFSSAKQLTTQQLETKEEEKAFSVRSAAVPWSGGASHASGADLRHRSNTTALRRDKDSLHPADVLRHRSNTAVAWKANALAASVVAAAQTSLPSLSASASASTPSESGSISSLGSNSTTSRARAGKTSASSRAALSSSGSGQFHFSRMNTQSSSTTAAIVAAMTAATSSASTSIPIASATVTSPPPRPQPMTTPQSTPAASSMTFPSRRQGSVPLPLHPVTSRPLAAMPEDSTTNEVESAVARNDMIPLPEPEQPQPTFVLFSDSKRESIWTRPDDGNDMIPLDL